MVTTPYAIGCAVSSAPGTTLHEPRRHTSKPWHVLPGTSASPPINSAQHRSREYQIWLRESRHVSASLFNQIVCALRFLYAEVLERGDEVQRIAYAREGEAAASGALRGRDGPVSGLD